MNDTKNNQIIPMLSRNDSSITNLLSMNDSFFDYNSPRVNMSPRMQNNLDEECFSGRSSHKFFKKQPALRESVSIKLEKSFS